jgi:hypothetical protein
MSEDAIEVAHMKAGQSGEHFTVGDAEAWARCEGAAEWYAFVWPKTNDNAYLDSLQRTQASAGYCIRR